MTRWMPPAIPPRQPGWEDRFTYVLSGALELPFAWGSADCLTLAADVCEALTGVQPFPADLRDYSTAEGAQRRLLELGFESIEKPLQTVFEEVPLARARRGDCGLRLADDVLSTFIVMGGTAIGKAPGRGVVVVPTLQLVRTFAIG